MKFTCKTFDRAGKAVESTVEAADIAAARESLRRQGLFVTDVRPAEGAAASRAAHSSEGRVRIGYRLKCVSMFARQLHVLVSSGTPLVQGLTAIARQAPPGDWSIVLEKLLKRIEEGAPLSDAMRLSPTYFDATCRSLAAAGEASGNMGVMLGRLAELTRKQLVLRNSIIGAMVYPCVLIAIGIAVLAMMLLFVLPRFEGLFQQLDSPLPPTTKMLVAVSNFLQGAWWAVLIAVGVAGTGGWMWMKSAAGQAWIDATMLAVPKLGTLTRSVITARLARTLGTLLESRVPLVDSLQLTRESTPNRAYADLIRRAEDAVGRGEPVSAVLAEGDLLSGCVQEAIRNGEQTGQLGAPLLQMADFLDEENDLVIKSATRLLEPLILSLLGLMVGFIAVSMFLPLFDLVSSARGGG